MTDDTLTLTMSTPTSHQSGRPKANPSHRKTGLGLLTDNARQGIVRNMLHFHSAVLGKRVLSVMLASMVWGLTSCASSLDMSGERLAAPGPEWGVVIGSVLVRPAQGASGTGAMASDRSTMYEFDVVQIQPADPDGESPYADRYHLEAVAGQERPFLSRLRPGQYLIKNFHRSGVAGTGGDLNLIFESQPAGVVYVSRVLVEVPQQVTSGKEYRFSVQDARETTLAQLASQHGNLTQQAVTAPMRIRRDEPR